MSEFHANEPIDPLLASLSAEIVHRYQLENGLTVIHKEDHAAGLISVQTWAKTGSIHEGAKLGAGLSHYLEHLLFKGTERRGPLDISREVNASGGYINAYTTFDRTVYYIDAPASAAESCFDLLADMCFHSKLPSSEIQRERDVILREIDMGLDDPDRRLFHTFANTAFREHPYRHPVIGHRPLFESVTESDLRNYFAGRYAPNNLVLVVVGALSEAECRELAEKHFGPAPMRQLAPSWFPEEPSQLAPRESRSTGDFNVVRGMIGYKTPGLAHADAPALDVLARLLGHGSSSWLWQSLRERQRLVHEISAGCWNPGQQGLFWITYICDPGKREAVEEAVRAELRQAVERLPSSEDVAKSTRQTLVGEINSRKTVTGQAGRLGSAEVVAGDLGFPRQHLARLAALTPDAVQDAAGRYLADTTETAASLEPTSVSVSAPSIARSGGLPDFEEIRYDNGARLLLQPAGDLPKTHIRFAALGGPLWEPADQRGATGVLATLLTRDTTQRSHVEIAEAIESVGGAFNEFVGNNTFGLSLETLSSDFPLAAELLDDALLRPAFLDEAFSIERDAQLASLQEDEDEVLEWSRRRLRQRFFGDHPYGVDYLGTEEHLKSLTNEQIRPLAKRLIAGPNAVVTVTGQFARDEIVETLSPTLNALPSEFSPVDCPAPARPAEIGAHRLQRDREQAVVLVGYPDCGVRDGAEFLVSEALDEVFSGMSSRLFQHVREERGMAYFVGSQRIPGLDCGLFCFYAGTSPAQADAVLDEILKEVERARSGGLTADELLACQTRLIVRRQQGQQSLGSRAMQACLNALYGHDLNDWRAYPDRVRELTLDRLHEFAQRRFRSDQQLSLITLPG